MDQEKIEENVMKMVANHLGFPQFRLSLQTDLMDDLEADSLDIRELIITIEEQFGIKIPKKNLFQVRHIEDIIDAISENNDLI